MANWEEVKRLAADFQKIQLSSTTQRLSERNCVEIISWLIHRKQIDLIFTSDGKEYLTPTQLVQDIVGELYVNGGRVNYVDLAKSIGVDLTHITSHISEVLRNNKDIYSVVGQLIDVTYLTKVAGEINEKLQQQGQINVGDLTIHYDLPAEFLQHNVLERYLGKLIHAEQDKNDSKIFFTESFITRTKAQIKGALVGLTRPTPISVILHITNTTDKLFFSLFDQTAPLGFLTSRLQGALYIPNIYSRSQNEWVNSFYKQNNYIEYTALTKLGISDYKTYLKKQFSSEETILLKSCIISKSVIERIEADIAECVASKLFTDLQSSLPSICTEDDMRMVLDIVLTQKQKQVIVINYFIISTSYIDDLAKKFESLVEERSRLAVESGKFQQYITDLQVSSNKAQKGDVEVEDVKVDKREERRKKAAGGKSGGGTQGRETKTKSTKKGGRTSRIVESEDDYEAHEKKVTLELLNIDDIKLLIESTLAEEGLDELLDHISEYMLPILNEKGFQMASKIYSTTIADRTASRRHTHNDVQNKVNALLGDIRLFDKGLKLFPLDMQSQLCKYLLKTVCTDVVNEILNYLAAEKGLSTITDNFTNEQRLKFINNLPSECKNPLQILIKTLTGQSIDEFSTAVEESLPVCSMIVKKIDKKKDRVVILNHKHGLLEQLDKCEDPALALHLCSLIIFINATQNILHASGRHVASILAFLKPHLTLEHSMELSTFHDLVTLMLSGGSEADNVKEQLKEKMPLIKKITNDYKKPSSEKS